MANPRRDQPQVQETASPGWSRFAWLVPGLVAVLTFAGSVNSGFVVDDEWIIEKNEVAHDASNLGRIFSSEYWVGRGSQGGLYRPLTILTYAWNHAAGGLNPSGYHRVNVLLHALVSVLVFAVVRALGASLAIGVAAGVLYAVHPIHAEAVSNIVGRAELLSTAGVLAALLAHVVACRAPATPRAFCLHLASLAVFAAAIFCKENAITFVIVPALYDALFLRNGTTSAWKAVRKNLGWHAGYAVVAFGYLIARDAVLGGLTIEAIGFESNPIASLPAGTRIMTAIALVARYAGLMVFPKTLSYVYGPGAITPVTSMAAPQFLAGAAILAGLVVLTVLAWRRSSFVAFWGAFVLVTFSIVSNILVPIGTAFAERLLYLPSVGILALAAWGLARLAALLPAAENIRRLAFAGLVAVLAVAGAWRSWVRDLDWRSSRVLYLSQERTPVRSSQTTFNAGIMHFQDKAYDEALSLFRESMELYPSAKTLYFLGRTLGATGADAERERVYQETAERFPGNFYAELASGWLLARKDKYAEALPHFRQALQLRPDDGGARYNVGVSLVRTNDLQGAVGVLSEGLDVGEMAAERRELLAKAHDALGNSASAADARKGLGSQVADAVAPARGVSSASPGFRLMNEGRYLEARKVFQDALAADPRDYAARLGMGVVSHHLGDDVVATSVLSALRAESRKLDESGYLALARAYQQQDRPTEAVAVLGDAIGLYPESTSLLEQLAFIEYSVLKQYAAAAPRFRKLLELRSRPSAAERLRGRPRVAQGPRVLTNRSVPRRSAVDSLRLRPAASVSRLETAEAEMRLSIHSCVVVIAMMALGIGARGQASCTPAFTPGVSSLCGVEGNSVSDCAFFDHGSGPVLYVTGSMTSAGGIPVSRIARWDGVSWSDVGGGLNGNYGSRFAVHDDGSGPALYVVGSFTAAGGVPANNVARWNGTNWSAVGPGLPVPGYSLAAGVLGGVPSLFAASLGALSGAVFRWTGSTWTQIATADEQIYTLAIEDLGSGPKLYVGGRFSNIAGIAASKIASFDGTTWQPLGTGIPAGTFTSVKACRAFGGELFVGGDFPAAPGITADIARWNGVQWLPGGMTFSTRVYRPRDLRRWLRPGDLCVRRIRQLPELCSVDRLWLGGRRRWSQQGRSTRMATFDTPGPGGLLAMAGDLIAVNWFGGVFRHSGQSRRHVERPELVGPRDRIQRLDSVCDELERRDAGWRGLHADPGWSHDERRRPLERQRVVRIRRRPSGPGA